MAYREKRDIEGVCDEKLQFQLCRAKSVLIPAGDGGVGLDLLFQCEMQGTCHIFVLSLIDL
jgi:hypothetical protein